MEIEDQEINDDSNSSDSSDLPDLFSREKVAFDVRKLKHNQVVWAEYKGLHWPALVRHVDEKNKKVSVSYCDSMQTCFKLPFKKVHDYRDTKFSKDTCDAAKSTAYAQKHINYVKRTDLFLSRRAFNHDDDPVEFFDLTKPYFVNLLLKNYDTKSLNVESLGNASTAKDVDEIIEPQKSSSDQLEESSNNEEEGNVDESALEGCSNKYLVFEEEKCPFDDEMVDKIISYIKSGRVDKYLVGVANSKIKSERHDLYIEATTKNQMTLLWNTPSDIPINDRKKLNDLNVHLRALYIKKFHKERRLLDEYIVSVWLPEAINKSILLIETEAHELPVGLGSNDISNSPNNVAHYDGVIGTGKMEASELPVDSGDHDLSRSSKRKIKSHSTKAEDNSNVHEVDECSSSRKKRKVSRGGIRSARKPTVKQRSKADITQAAEISNTSLPSV